MLGKDAKSAFFATLALRLKPEVMWEVDTLATDGKRLIVAPARASERRKKFEEAQATPHKRHGRAFKRLAE